jgi:hypothetical protein
MDVRTALFALVALCSSGCGTLFNANFDSDTVGLRPSEWPPGPPGSDRVFIPAWTSVDSYDVFPVVYFDETNTGNIVHYFNTRVDPAVKWMGFFGRRSRSSSDEYWYAWNGRLDGQSPLELQFVVGNIVDAFWTITVLRITDSLNGATLELLTDEHPRTFETIGRLRRGRDEHAIVLHFDKETRHYSLTVYPGPPPDSDVRPAPIRTPMRPSLLGATIDLRSAPNLILLFPERGIFSSYIIDDLRITETCPRRIAAGDGSMIRYDCR